MTKELRSLFHADLSAVTGRPALVLTTQRALESRWSKGQDASSPLVNGVEGPGLIPARGDLGEGAR